MTLYGRHQEETELDRVLTGARKGTGAGLVLWGDPGIGKTALMEYATASATDFTVLSCRGTRMESGLAFAALHELLWPVVDRIGALPAPQAAALRGALGHSGDVPDRFLIGAAVLTLLSELGGEQPVLLVADDAQWLDAPTVECLCFVVRRLRTEPVALLLTSHADPATGPWAQLPALGLGGLDDADARRLAAAATPSAGERLLARTVRTAGGNPLALQELPGALEAAGPSAPGERVAVGPRLRRAFNARVEALGPRTRTLLLLAAAEERGERWALREAAGVLGVGTAAWDEALRHGLLDTHGDRVRIRHPLVRTVVYEEAPFTERQAVHRALACVLAGAGEDADELRAWHLASACDGPDEDVAALLVAVADRAWARGGCASAAQILRRAAELSPCPDGAAVRLARGARAAWEAGQVPAARELLARATHLSSEDAVAELSGGLRGLIEFGYGDQRTAHRHLMRDVRAVSRPGKKLELATMAVRAGWTAGAPALHAAALDVLAGLPDVPPLVGWWREDGAPPALTEDTVARLGASSWRLIPPASLGVAWGAEEALAEAFRRKIAELRRTDAATAIVLTVPQTASLDAVRGRWGDATAEATEALCLAEEIGADHAATQCRSVLAWLAALRGDEETVTAQTDRTLEISVPRGIRALTAAAHWSRGLAALQAGRADEALQWLSRISEPGHAAAHGTFALLAAADTAEAAVRADHPDAALPHVRLLTRWADRTGTAWAKSATHRCEALLTEDPAAKNSHFLYALDGRPTRPFEQARTRLLYGEWLRRVRRRTEARIQLAEAAETFRRLGAPTLLERALHEQELTGQQLRRSPTPGISLTPQELRVARLAAEGLTNREIAAQLLISPRTVGHHLSNVFPKVGITSRADLARVDFDNGLRLTS
ncbi:LuxR C-terminal-related transcriptional regulator [Streptomyces olivoreticuli]|uniref:AAA family ATPase n=1 Tax=Streptomyces olivoreticuli TaxID=68246 RepID=UPI00265B6018|nr:LuxR family transcriptional regulator [Streptomyces olivoreticuli]WKK27143.1 LuxR C-terminal-related transcriptional regulator [Streptomyces olivoreticuli]